MKNSKVLFKELADSVTLKQDKEEIDSTIYLLLNHCLGLTRTNILAEKSINITSAQELILKESIQRFNAQEPVQYIIGFADFFGRKFHVNPSVLIPRPETEELVFLALNFLKQNKTSAPKICDVGTGSGCIAITLAAEVKNASVIASDISEDALITAKRNCDLNEVHVNLLQHSILKQPLPYNFFNIIVSNPPYIAEREQETMEKHVLGFEPHLALFVPDDDPFVFYKAITSQAKDALILGGLLAVEINEQFGNDVSELFKSSGFLNVEVVKDIFGKDRFVKGVKPN
jgi:release factor glutamine methyltransferase